MREISCNYSFSFKSAEGFQVVKNYCSGICVYPVGTKKMLRFNILVQENRTVNMLESEGRNVRRGDTEEAGA